MKDYRDQKFRLITVSAKLPDGRGIKQWHSFPRGVSYSTYKEINDAAVLAFGIFCVVEGTFL